MINGQDWGEPLETRDLSGLTQVDIDLAPYLDGDTEFRLTVKGAYLSGASGSTGSIRCLNSLGAIVGNIHYRRGVIEYFASSYNPASFIPSQSAQSDWLAFNFNGDAETVPADELQRADFYFTLGSDGRRLSGRLDSYGQSGTSDAPEDAKIAFCVTDGAHDIKGLRVITGGVNSWLAGTLKLYKLQD